MTQGIDKYASGTVIDYIKYQWCSITIVTMQVVLGGPKSNVEMIFIVDILNWVVESREGVFVLTGDMEIWAMLGRGSEDVCLEWFTFVCVEFNALCVVLNGHPPTQHEQWTKADGGVCRALWVAMFLELGALFVRWIQRTFALSSTHHLTADTPSTVEKVICRNIVLPARYVIGLVASGSDSWVNTHAKCETNLLHRVICISY